MQTRRIANTDIYVSVMGLGTVKFGRTEGVKYPHPFNLPTDNEIKNLLAIAKEMGINLLDTAPAYGVSEERLGKLLAPHRKDWIISTKVGETFAAGESAYDFSAKSVRASVERSLKHLQTDYLDIVLVHSNGDDIRIIEEDDIFNTLASLKQAGKIRSYGMSSKTIAGGLLTLEHSDIAMITYHPAYPDEREVIQKAHQKQKSIFIKKALASGHLLNSQDPVADSFQFIFAEPGVTSIIVGTINSTHLQENAKKLMLCY